MFKGRGFYVGLIPCPEKPCRLFVCVCARARARARVHACARLSGVTVLLFAAFFLYSCVLLCALGISFNTASQCLLKARGNIIPLL